MKDEKELRMYTLVLYQLSGIQAGIQAGHAWVEYGGVCKDSDLYNEWAQNHKTVMVMNGGSTITMAEHIQTIRNMGVEVVEFKEPDLGDLTTAACFIVSSDVYDFDEVYLEDCELLFDNDLIKEVEGRYALYSFLRKFRFHGGR